MLRLFVLFTCLCCTNAYAMVDYVTVDNCRGFIFGKATEKDIQEGLNKKLKDALNKAGAQAIDYVQYGNYQTFLRGKDNSCALATAWFHR